MKRIEKKLKEMKTKKYLDTGMFLEVDLLYPDKLHAEHCDFPLAPERYNVVYNELSPMNKFLYQKRKIP